MANINDLLAQDELEKEQSLRSTLGGGFHPDTEDHLEEEENALEIGEIGTKAAERNNPESLGEIGIGG